MDEGELRGYHAITLRLHDPASGQWSLYWITSLSGATIEPPVTGRFDGGCGDFLGPDTHNGIPVVVRYRWTVLARTRAGGSRRCHRTTGRPGRRTGTWS